MDRNPRPPATKMAEKIAMRQSFEMEFYEVMRARNKGGDEWAAEIYRPHPYYK